MRELRKEIESLKAELTVIARRIKALEEKLARAASSGATPPDSAGPAGRRRSIRRKGLLRADYGTGRDFYSDIATDLSEGGICIESARPQKQGARLDIVLEVPNADLPLRLKGEVVQVRELVVKPGAARKYALGIRFFPMDGWTQGKLKEFLSTLPADKQKLPFAEDDRGQWLAKLKESGL